MQAQHIYWFWPDRQMSWSGKDPTGKRLPCSFAAFAKPGNVADRETSRSGKVSTGKRLRPGKVRSGNAGRERTRSGKDDRERSGREMRGRRTIRYGLYSSSSPPALSAMRYQVHHWRKERLHGIIV